jgi:hypothetical protein
MPASTSSKGRKLPKFSGTPLNPNQKKILSMEMYAPGKLRIYASQNLTQREKAQMCIDAGRYILKNS